MIQKNSENGSVMKINITEIMVSIIAQKAGSSTTLAKHKVRKKTMNKIKLKQNCFINLWLKENKLNKNYLIY